ncbi:MAG: SocA family protein [Desulfurococcales archaeon]|nr:SocA family protein [Desulfurococcales archaeon]
MKDTEALSNKEAKAFIAYILYKLGCLHPFKLSRLLALAEIESVKRRGRRLTNLKYVPGPGSFYIEGIKELFDDKCFEKREGDPRKGIKGCVRYICEPPKLPDDVAGILDYVIERYGSEDEFKLNDMVVNSDEFKRLLVG